MRRLLVLVLLAGAAWAFFAWPRINDVTTSETKAYPELQDKSYGVGPDRVAQAAKEVIGRLPRWTLKGAGEGPGGWSIQAERKTRTGFVDEITVRIRREAGRTKVKMRSRSRSGKIDFGQNARNIREFLTALDAEVR
jgi:uncharacterized protein (DUF1499 family)